MEVLETLALEEEAFFALLEEPQHAHEEEGKTHGSLWWVWAQEMEQLQKGLMAGSLGYLEQTVPPVHHRTAH